MPTEDSFQSAGLDGHITTSGEQDHALLSAVVNASDDAILSKTLDGVITTWNPAATRMFGYTADEMIGKPSATLFPPDRLQEEEIILDQLQREIQTDHFETVWLHKDGAPLHVSVTISPMKDRDGRMIGACTIARDITECKRTEEHFRESNDIAASKEADEKVQRFYQRLAYHFENTPLAVIEWDETFHVRHWSAGAERVFGWTAAEREGKHFEDWKFVYEEDREAAYAVAARLQNGTEPRNVHFNRNYTKSGRVIECEWYNSMLHGEDGAWYSMLSLALDVTDRKRTEAQLVQAQKMESIGRLAGGIAHDFNNLLAIILGYSEVVEEGLLHDSELLPNIRNIKGAANRAATLTRQLLGFARRQASQPQVVSPSDLLLAFTTLLKPLLTVDVEMVLAPGENVGNVEMDPTHLEQIVMNLAINARDAMPQGGALILKTENVTLTEPRLTEWGNVIPGDYVRLSVTDTGVGMTEEVRQHLFEPFFTTKAKGQGTGLGLATVYGLVKQASGYIWVYSEVGSGTTFTIYLPRVDVALAAYADEEASVASGGAETLLVVEDEPLMRELTVNILQKGGYMVLVAENGAEALRVLKSHPAPVALVVTDAIMPLMGGRELVEQLRLLRPDVCVLVVSGYSEEGYAAQSALPAGVEFLHKPFTARALLEKVRQSLNV
jgi:two-component system cell cycle sensor histidine kinase/response regulator CckA